MSMNDFLEQVYANNDPEALTVEKLAQAQVTQELLLQESNGQIGLDDITVPELYKVASELFGEDSILAMETAAAYEKLAEEEQEYDGDGLEEEEEYFEDPEEVEKIASNADASGRIMAHAFIDELRGMDKEASVAEKVRGAAGYVGGAIRSGAGRVGGAAQSAGGAIRSGAVRAGKGVRDAATLKDIRTGMSQRRGVKGAGKYPSQATKDVRAAGNRNIRKGLVRSGALYGAAGGAAGGAYAMSRRGKKKQASLLDIVAEAREYTEKQAEFHDLVNARAYEILEEAGLE